MARPTKLNPEIRERILDALRDGNRRVTAARLAGVGSPCSTADGDWPGAETATPASGSPISMM